MTQVLSTTIEKNERDGQLQPERGGSASDFAIITQGLLFSGEIRDEQEKALIIQKSLSEIRSAAPAVRPTPIPHQQSEQYQSDYVPEAISPEAEPERVVEKPNDSKILGIFPRPKTPAEMFKRRQEALRKAA